MRCRQCQTENPEGAKFCRECGAPLDRVCPSCGSTNPGNFKFCSNCGFNLAAPPPAESPSPPLAETPPSEFAASLTRAAPASLVDPLRHLPAQLPGERRKVTILFADLKGSTALGERLDAEEIYDVMNRCFTALVKAVDRHEGFVDKFTGDGIMALFGAPRAHGDDPQRAVRAALDMQTWLADFSQELERRKGVPFQMRLGLNFGTVVAGGIGSDRTMTYDVLGDAVNVAKRLEEMAEPGSIFVSASVQKLTRRQFDYDYVGPLSVKGREEEVSVYRVLGSRSQPADEEDDPFATRLIGRSSEWRALVSAIDELSTGAGRLITIVGEPGIGKTRLLEEASDYAAELGIATRIVRCSERHMRSPYELFRSLLSDLCGLKETDAPDRMAQKVAGAAAGLAPELREWVPYLVHLVSSASTGPEQSGLDQQTRKQLTIRGLCELVASLCRDGPLVLILDDLQWSDALSLEVLHEVTRRLDGLSLALLAAYRPDTPHEWPPSHRHFRLALDILGRDQSRELIHSFIRPGVLPERVLEAILDRSGGNPYYLEELLRSLADSGQLRREGDQWEAAPEIGAVDLPDTVYGAIMARLDRIERVARTVIQGGSVVGLRFPVRLVQDLLEVRGSLESTLLRLESLQFVREQSPPPEWEYRFKHTAIREVAYSTLLLQQRKQYHRRIAELVEALYAGREAEASADLAYHCRMAELWPRAVQYVVLAGDRATDLYANPDAIRHYTEALELLQRPELAEEASRHPYELEAHEGLGEIYSRLADYPAAVASYARALKCAYLACLGSCERALRLAGLKRGMAKCLFETGAQRRADQLLREAFRGLRRDDSAAASKERSMIIVEMGFARYRSGRYREAERLGRWSYRLAETARAELAMGDASNLLGLACVARGRFGDAIEQYKRTLEVAERTGNIAVRGQALNNLGNLYYQQARFDEAERFYERAHREWKLTGDVVQLATTSSNVGNVHLVRGNYAGAAASFKAAIAMFRQANHPYGEAAAVAGLGEVYLEWGRLEEAISSLHEALALAETVSVPDLMAYIHSVLAAVSVERREVEEAERQCRRALELTESIEHAAFEGVVRRILGRIARLRSDAAAAEAELERAETLFAENHLPYELGRTLVEHGSLLAEMARAPEAEQRFAHAITLFRESGAHADLERAQAAAAALRRHAET